MGITCTNHPFEEGAKPNLKSPQHPSSSYFAKTLCILYTQQGGQWTDGQTTLQGPPPLPRGPLSLKGGPSVGRLLLGRWQILATSRPGRALHPGNIPVQEMIMMKRL